LKYAVTYRNDPISQDLTNQFHKLAEHYDLAHDENDPDIVLSIGGDGTMLQSFHKYIQGLDHISFVGIHTGRLGFFADWKPDKIDEVAKLISQSATDQGLRVVEYPVVELEISTTGGCEKRYALNEFTIKSPFVTLVAQLSINDEPFETFRGDGICISSPTGSTAYNKSLGGAIVHPSIEAIQVTEIASINNRVYRTLGSPLILPKHHHFDIVPKSQQQFILSIDHHYMERNDVRSIRCRISSDKKVKFARFKPFPFWTRVREAFIGNDMQ